MSLAKLAPSRTDIDVLQKAGQIINSIPSKNLILEAYLFGSSVSGVFTHDSDLDLLVVVAEADQIKLLMSEVYKVGFADIAIDWIFKTASDFAIRKDFGGVCFEAYHHGKKII